MSTANVPQCNVQSKITLLDSILEYKLRLLRCTFIIGGAQHSRISYPRYWSFKRHFDADDDDADGFLKVVALLRSQYCHNIFIIV